MWCHAREEDMSLVEMLFDHSFEEDTDISFEM